MDNSDDNFSLIPTELDLSRLNALQINGRVESENQVWVCLRYQPSEIKGWRWCEYSLIVNCPGIAPHTAPYEFKNLKAMISYLEQLEKQRLANNES